jgi:hypothetical protein
MVGKCVRRTAFYLTLRLSRLAVVYCHADAYRNRAVKFTFRCFPPGRGGFVASNAPVWRWCNPLKFLVGSLAESLTEGSRTLRSCLPCLKPALLPIPAEAVDWRNAHVSAPSYRRVSARWIMLAHCAPRLGEVGHDDAANSIAAARPITTSSGLARFLASVPPCDDGAGQATPISTPGSVTTTGLASMI